MEIVSTLRKYREPPEDEDTFNELFEQTLDDMMLKEELRAPMRNRGKQDKWMIIKNQMKSNLKSNFTMLSTLELLKGVCFLSSAHSSRSPFPARRRAKWIP